MIRRDNRRKDKKAEGSVFQERFRRLAVRMGKRSHGAFPYPKRLNLLFKDLSKEERRTFIPGLFRDPVIWEDIGGKIWGTEDEINANKFPFLQGDIVHSISPFGLPGRSRWADAESGDDPGDIWMILSADCDCARKDLISVAPTYRVLEGHERKGRFGIFCETAAFNRFYRFPIPRLLGDEANVVGYVADLQEPFFLDRQRVAHESHKRLASMTPEAWHVLNSMLFHDRTRANHSEGVALRTV